MENRMSDEQTVHLWIGDVLLPDDEKPIPLFTSNGGVLVITVDDANHITKEEINCADQGHVLSDNEIEFARLLQSRFPGNSVYRSSLSSMSNKPLIDIELLPALCTTIDGMTRTLTFLAMTKNGLFSESPPTGQIGCIGTSTLIMMLSDMLNMTPQTVSYYIRKHDQHNSTDAIPDLYSMESAAEIAMRIFTRH